MILHLRIPLGPRASIKKIRLPESQLTIIKRCFCELFEKGDHLWIFGSNVDLNRKGGDLDFYIETSISDPEKAIMRKFAFVNRLWESLGDQKIDVVLNILTLKTQLHIYEIAKSEGVMLV